MEKDLHPRIQVRIFTDDSKCFGPGVAALLCAVQKKGSLRAAATGMGMAYSKAWRVIKDAETALGFMLLTRTVGGKAGGGAVLTPEAARFLKNYQAYEAMLEENATRLFAEYFQPQIHP